MTSGFIGNLQAGVAAVNRYRDHGTTGRVLWHWRGRIRALLVWPLLLLSALAFADVRETPHNLIKSRDKSVDEKQVCVFCHTPAADLIVNLPEGTAPVLAQSPVWQPRISGTHTFTLFDDIGRLGLGAPSVGSQSIACLSCHDSSQADSTAGRVSLDHPFGVPYRGATRSMPSVIVPRQRADSGLPFREARHTLALEDFREVSEGKVENRPIYWVSRQGATSRRTRGDLPLYGRVVGGLAEGSELSALEGVSVPHIECSSCHDPHAKTATFLRVSPEESKLCLTCHDK